MAQFVEEDDQQPERVERRGVPKDGDTSGEAREKHDLSPIYLSASGGHVRYGAGTKKAIVSGEHFTSKRDGAKPADRPRAAFRSWVPCPPITWYGDKGRSIL
ncbi:MAG: hypothetical protein AMXMBFR4_02050 [Candidatus Hydrogenedentota bacterium]